MPNGERGPDAGGDANRERDAEREQGSARIGEDARRHVSRQEQPLHGRARPGGAQHPGHAAERRERDALENQLARQPGAPNA